MTRINNSSSTEIPMLDQGKEELFKREINKTKSKSKDETENSLVSFLKKSKVSNDAYKGDRRKTVKYSKELVKWDKRKMDPVVLQYQSQISSTTKTLEKRKAKLTLLEESYVRAQDTFQKEVHEGKLTVIPSMDEMFLKEKVLSRLSSKFISLKARFNLRIDENQKLRSSIDKHRKYLDGLRSILSKLEKRCLYLSSLAETSGLKRMEYPEEEEELEEVDDKHVQNMYEEQEQFFKKKVKIKDFKEISSITEEDNSVKPQINFKLQEAPTYSKFINLINEMEGDNIVSGPLSSLTSIQLEKRLTELSALRLHQRYEYEKTHTTLINENKQCQSILRNFKSKNISDNNNAFNQIKKYDNSISSPSINNAKNSEEISKEIVNLALENISLRKSIKNYRDNYKYVELAIHLIMNETDTSKIEVISQSLSNMKRKNSNFLLLVNSINHEVNVLKKQNKNLFSKVNIWKSEYEQWSRTNENKVLKQKERIKQFLNKGEEEELKCNKIKNLFQEISEDCKQIATLMGITLDRQNKYMLEGIRSNFFSIIDFSKNGPKTESVNTLNLNDKLALMSENSSMAELEGNTTREDHAGTKSLNSVVFTVSGGISSNTNLRKLDYENGMSSEQETLNIINFKRIESLFQFLEYMLKKIQRNTNIYEDVKLMEDNHSKSINTAEGSTNALGELKDPYLYENMSKDVYKGKTSSSNII